MYAEAPSLQVRLQAGVSLTTDAHSMLSDQLVVTHSRRQVSGGTEEITPWTAGDDTQ